MPDSTTMTIRIPTDVKAKLERIAVGTRRSKSFLAGEAVAAYVDRELEIIEGIDRAIADADAGRVVSHDEAVARLRQVLKGGRAKSE